MRRSIKTLLPVAPIAAAILALLSGTKHAGAAGGEADAKEKTERCGNRLSIAMVGESATAAILASNTPQDSFDTLVNDPRFVERFSRFVNSQFNITPGTTPSEDASYYLAKFVLTNAKVWKEMFVGGYDVVPQNANQAGSEAIVNVDADGLGYFRSRAWAVRYAGNELAGIRIVTAYRMMQNTVGLKLTAVTTAPNTDTSAAGRQSGACAGCHFEKWYALDKVATVLGTRTGTGNNTRFTAPSAGPQQILGGATVSNDKELVEALVSNEAFNVNACRLAFKFLYARDENSCEGPVFDRCVDAFKKDGMIQSALATVAKDPGFCE